MNRICGYCLTENQPIIVIHDPSLGKCLACGVCGGIAFTAAWARAFSETVPITYSKLRHQYYQRILDFTEAARLPHDWYLD